MRPPSPPYTWAAVLLSSITLPVLALLVSLHVSSQSVRREEQARRASEKAMCAVIITQDDVYRESPPSTGTGKRVAEGMANLRQAYRCDLER